MVLGTVLMAGPLTAEILPGRTAQSSEASKTEAARTEAARSEAKAEARKAEKPDTNKSDTETNKTESGKPESGKPEKEQGRDSKPDSARPDAAKADGAASHADESTETTRQVGAAGRGECLWIGTRIVGLVWKDDLDTAFRHLELYDRFGCPGEHLQLSFRCITRWDKALKEQRELKEQKEQQGEQKEPKEQREHPDTFWVPPQNVFDKAVGDCWTDPATPAPPPPAAAAEKPAPK